MNIPNKGQSEYIVSGILKNIRQDGRVNTQRRSKQIQTGILLGCLGSCYLEEEDNKIYVGIKMEIGNVAKDSPKEGIININVESMKRRNISENFKNVNVDKEKINYLKSFIQLNYLRKIDKSSLVLIEDKKCWIITIDVFLLNFVDESQLENIILCIKQAFLDLRIPQIKITHNYLTNEDTFELIEDKNDPIKFAIPELIIIGQISGHYIFDMTTEEFYSVDRKYVVVQNNNKVELIRSFESNDQGILPDLIMNLYKGIQNSN